MVESYDVVCGHHAVAALVRLCGFHHVLPLLLPHVVLQDGGGTHVGAVICAVQAYANRKEEGGGHGCPVTEPLSGLVLSVGDSGRVAVAGERDGQGI